MTAIVSPILTAAVGLGNLRFFASPLSGPQQPWHAVEDLQACMTLPRDLRRILRSRLRKDWPKDTRVIETAEGPVSIGPHYMAQGLISAMKECGHEPPGFEAAYTHAICEAMNVLTAGMSDQESINYTVAAFRNSNGIPGPHPNVPIAPMRGRHQ